MRTCDEEGCSKPHRARGLCVTHWNRKYGKPKKRYAITCVVCSAEHMSSRMDGKYCSDACKATAMRKIPSTELVLWVPSPVATPIELEIAPPAPRQWYAGACRRCGASFVSKWSRNRYCSRGCLRSDHKAKRRARKKGAYVSNVSRIQIFERDKWTCQLCHRKVNRNVVVPHPRAPVLDHIVPLAADGTHEPANVQCAHFLCNSTKGMLGGGEQLMLVG